MPDLQSTNYQFPQDIPHVTDDRGTAALVVRKDIAASLVDADSDYTVLIVDDEGKLWARAEIDGAISTTPRTGTLANGTQVAVSTVAVQLIAANANRRSLLLQNVGLGRVRIGITGVTATTGFLLYPGGHLILNTEDVPTNAIFAIRDGAPDTTILVQEIT